MFAHRVYAVTGRNKWIGSALALTIFVQFCHGIFSVVWHARVPSKSLNHFTVRVRTHRFLVELFPVVNLDPFELCAYKRWKLGELMYYNLAPFFGKSSPSSLQHRFTPGVLTRLTFHIPHVVVS